MNLPKAGVSWATSRLTVKAQAGIGEVIFLPLHVLWSVLLWGTTQDGLSRGVVGLSLRLALHTVSGTWGQIARPSLSLFRLGQTVGSPLE